MLIAQYWFVPGMDSSVINMQTVSFTTKPK